jgi:hypothetical protein
MCVPARSHLLSLSTILAPHFTLEVNYNKSHEALAIDTLRAFKPLCFCSVSVVADALSLPDTPAETRGPVAELTLPATGRWRTYEHLDTVHVDRKFGVSIEREQDSDTTTYTLSLEDICTSFHPGALVIKTYPGTPAFSYRRLESPRDTKEGEFLDRTSGVWIEVLHGGKTSCMRFSFAFLLEIARMPRPVQRRGPCARASVAGKLSSGAEARLRMA